MSTNTFLEVKEIARQALPRLMENLVVPNLIHKDFSEEFASGKGSKIQVRKPVLLEAETFDAEKGTTAQDITETSVEVTLDQLATVDVELTALQSATSVDDLNRIFVEPAAAALAQKINADGLNLYKDIPYVCGTAGTTPSSLSAFADAEKVLNLNKAPVAPRYAVWSPEADAAFKQIDAVVHAEKSGSTAALRNGSIGRIFGLENHMSQAVKAHKAGKLSAAAKSKEAANIGAETLTLAATTLTGTLYKGDILTILDNTYVVTEDATATNNEIVVNIYPALKKDITTNTAITVAANHTANLAFHPSAFAFVTRPLSTPSGVESYVTSFNGISLRVTKGYDMKHKKDMLSMDVLYGYKTMYPELATRVLG